MTEAETNPEPRPELRLGSYLLLHQLGTGGMSSVYKAVHEDTGNIVAVKVLPREFAKNTMLLQRFLREAKSAEALDHPNIVAIYDRGFDRGRHYLVLEYVEGGDLQDRVKKQGPLPIDEATRVIRQSAEALRYAAKRGMIHRDIKPANILLPPDGVAKVIDLGLALQVDDEDERVTRDGTTVGTVDYMSPEQARDSRRTSERSDIYSLGCTFHYLLTGKPPYPGGNVADKLSRHFTAPVPDPGILRPDVPAGLGRVLRRMMAKRPEDRYQDYDHLIHALDHPEEEPIEVDIALISIDDEEDSRRPASSGGQGRRARDSTLTELSTSAQEKSSPTGHRLAPAPAAPELSLADLAALSDHEAPAEASRHDMYFDSDDRDDYVESALITGARTTTPGSEFELSLRTWIAAGVMVGVVLALFGVAASILLSSGDRKDDHPILAGQADPSVVEEDAPPEAIVTPPPPAPVMPKPAPAVETVSAPPASPVEAEPTPSTAVREKEYPAEWIDRLTPRFLVAPYPEEPVTIVRRLVESGEETQAPSLALAFGQVGGVVEIADTGPFFEDDFHIVGKARVIRARAGLRPIIKLDYSDLTAVKEREATFVLGGQGRLDRLCLEGVDFVVDARDLPRTQTSLFLCRGAEVIFRNCTLTVLNSDDRSLSLFRLEEGERPNRIVLDRTLVRGPVRTLATVACTRAEISLDRSAVFGASSPIFAVGSGDKAARSIWLTRSVIATRGPLVELSGRSAPLILRALGTSMGRVDGGTKPPLILARSRPIARPAEILDWAGEDNDFIGWPSWLATFPESSTRLADLASVVATWEKSDQSSRESRDPWPAELANDESLASQLEILLPDRRGTLAKVASPHPRLRDVAIGLAARQGIPDLAEFSVATPTPTVDLDFDLLAAPWNGNLGAFLAQMVTDVRQRYIVRVRGMGTFPMTPVRLPDGASVAIVAESPSPESEPPAWISSGEVAGRAMIELHGGDLALTNLSFVSDAKQRPQHWVQVEGGWLALKRCRLRDAGETRPEVGSLVAFSALSGDPLPSRLGPFAQPVDRPICLMKDSLLWTGGDAIEAEVGRGTVSLESCLLIAGKAIILQPAKVDPSRFDADLVMDHSTIAYNQAGVLVRSWPGDPKGPDRPWMISTHACVFPRVQEEGEGALLTLDPDTMARGVVFWQSLADLYETQRFLRTIDPARSAPLPYVDVKKQWVEVWGSQHIRSPIGPTNRRSEHLLQFRERERPKPRKVTPESLELDPSYHHDIGVNFESLPLGPRG